MPLAALAQAGLRQFAGLPGAMTLAQWLAAPAGWPAGDCAASGVLAVDLLLADGVEETLGPFGADDLQPLRSATVQRLVPALFQLVGGDLAAACRDGDAWLARYRLDALAPQAPATVNLAHLMLGQGGTLAWVRGVTLADCPPAETGAACAPRADGLAPRTAGAVAAAPRQATALQARIKALFDPYGRFPEFTSPPNSDSL